MSRQIKIISLSFALLVSISISGCGTQEYELGLNKTASYYAYVEKMDMNLTKKAWKGSGVTIRIPIQFDLVRAPAQPEETEEGTEETKTTESVEPDRRQPNFLNVEFPGLLATWKADVDNDDPDGTFPCYIYLLSNSSLWDSDERSDLAINFTDEVTNRLVDGLKTEFPEEWSTEEIPPKVAYVDKKKYTSTVIYPEEPVKLSEETEPVKIQTDIYLKKNGDIQSAIIFLYPQGISDSEKLSQRIQMSLETFELSGKNSSKPKKSSGKSRKGRKKKKPSVGF